MYFDEIWRKCSFQKDISPLFFLLSAMKLKEWKPNLFCQIFQKLLKIPFLRILVSFNDEFNGVYHFAKNLDNILKKTVS